MIKILYIPRSNNAKTGDISQTYSACTTCSASCPFKGHGCYGENFTTRINWKRANCTEKTLSDTMDEKGHTHIVRHNVAGDMCKPGTSELDTALLHDLIKAWKATGVTAYTYTHADKVPMNFIKVQHAIEQGFIVNMSCETLEQVKVCHENHVPAVLAVYDWTEKNKVTRRIDGITYRLCPATYDKNITCRDCGKCWKSERKEVIVFPAHGIGKKKTRDFLIDL